MSVQVENLEKNMAKLIIEVSEDKLEAALQNAYQKQKSRISLPGFRKGKVPRKMIEKMYGPQIFFEDAANELIQENYSDAAKESGIDIVSRPTVDITQIEQGKPFIFTAEVAVRPEVQLGSYKGVAVAKADTDVTDEEVDEAIEKERVQNARIITVEDRAIENGDTAVIDFEGFVDGEAFEGGKGENHSLEIGSHSFIDTFEEQLIGKNSGDEVEVSVVFPEEYHDEELAGRPAVFQVKIHEIKTKELPDLDDEFAQDVADFDTLDEYKADVRKKLAEGKAASAKQAKEEEAIRKIVEASTMELPEAMIETQVEIQIENFAQRIAMQGMSFEQYMQMTAMTMDRLKEQVRPDAESRIKSSLVLEQIVKEENIEASDEDVEAEIEKMAEMYGIEADKAKEDVTEEERDSIKKDIAVQKAVDLIMEHAIEE
ncbi:MAG: trigger factor [Lachnospiraceae bacterium]|nr:trigger factor [Lachnospiraceae bacterium]